MLEHDADSALADLERETRGLPAAAESAGQDLAAAEQTAAQMSQTLSDAENLLERLTAELAEWNAKNPDLTDDELARVDQHAVEAGINLWAKQTEE